MKMITISNCASASTKPGQMSMLERREPRGAIAMNFLKPLRSAPDVFRQGGNGSCDDADITAQIVHALLAALDDVLAEPRDIGFDVAQMVAQHVIVSERVLYRFRETGKRWLQLQLVVGQPHHKGLTRLHLLAEDAEAVRQAGEGRIGADPAFLPECENSLKVFETVGSLLEQGLDIGRYRSVASVAQGAGRETRMGRQRLLELVVEPVLCLAGLQVEKAQHKAAGEPEQGRAERRSHPVERRLQAGFEVGKGPGDVAGPEVQRADDIAHRPHRLE